jgi:hypothetical protein
MNEGFETVLKRMRKVEKGMYSEDYGLDDLDEL